MGDVSYLGSYTEVQEIAQNNGLIPQILDLNTHFVINLQLGQLTYHRHIIKNTAEAVALLADYWPYVNMPDLIEFGTYTSPSSQSISYASRKEVVAVSPQPGRTLTVSSKTANTLTFPANTFFRSSFSAVAARTVTQTGATLLTVAGANRSFTASDVGMRIIIEEAGQDTTDCYVVGYNSAVSVFVDGALQGAYTAAATVRENLINRFIVLRPLIALNRFPVIGFSNDTVTVQVPYDITGSDSFGNYVGASVRLCEEYLTLDRLIVSGSGGDFVCNYDFVNINQPRNVLGKTYYVIAGGSQLLTAGIALSGKNRDIFMISLNTLANSTPTAFITMFAKWRV